MHVGNWIDLLTQEFSHNVVQVLRREPSPWVRSLEIAHSTRYMHRPREVFDSRRNENRLTAKLLIQTYLPCSDRYYSRNFVRLWWCVLWWYSRLWEALVSFDSCRVRIVWKNSTRNRNEMNVKLVSSSGNIRENQNNLDIRQYASKSGSVVWCPIRMDWSRDSRRQGNALCLRIKADCTLENRSTSSK